MSRNTCDLIRARWLHGLFFPSLSSSYSFNVVMGEVAAFMREKTKGPFVPTPLPLLGQHLSGITSPNYQGWFLGIDSINIKPCLLATPSSLSHWLAAREGEQQSLSPCWAAGLVSGHLGMRSSWCPFRVLGYIFICVCVFVYVCVCVWGGVGVLASFRTASTERQMKGQFGEGILFDVPESEMTGT